MVAAYEVLIVTSSVANLIREDKIAQINNAMTTSKSIGMMLMDNSLENLANKGLISKGKPVNGQPIRAHDTNGIKH